MKKILIFLAAFSAALAQTPVNVQKGGSAGTNNLTADLNVATSRTLTIASGGSLIQASGGTISGAPTTALTLSGGSSGANVIMGFGVNGNISITPLGTGQTIIPNASPVYLSPFTGNAPWRVFSAPAVSPDAVDEVFYITSNARFDPTSGWQNRDVNGLGGISFQLENHWTNNGAVNTAEWNLDFANIGSGPFVSNNRALAFIHDWITGAESWKFSQGSGSWVLTLDNTGATVGTALTSNGPLTVTSGAITTYAGTIQGRSSGGAGLALNSNDSTQPIIFKIGSAEFGRFAGTANAPLLIGSGVSDIGGNTQFQIKTGGGGILVDSGSANSGTYPGLQLKGSGAGWGTGIQLNNTAGSGRKWGIYADNSNGLQWTDETGGYAWASNAGGTIAAGSHAILYTLEATTGGAGSLTTAGGLYAAKKAFFAGGILGTATNNNAGTGIVGEFVSSLVAIGSPQSLSNNTAANVTSITLSAGDWDVEALASVTETTATVTARTAGISSTSATLPTDGTEGYNGNQSVTTTEANSIPLARVRMSLAGSTTVYLVEKVVFAAGTAGGFGSLNARRVR